MLYVIAGDGSGNKTEIVASLNDLREAAAMKDAEFWLIFVGKDEPTKTDGVIINWASENGVWFEVIHSDEDVTAEDGPYAGGQKVHVVKDGYRKALGMLTKAEEDVAILALPINAEESVEEDADLFSFLERAMDAQINVLLLNNQLAELELESGDEEEAEEEAEEEDEDEESEDEDEDDEEDEDEEEEAEDEEEAEEAEAEEPVFTKAYLNKMSTLELQSLAKGQKIDIRGLGKKDLVTALVNLANGEVVVGAEPATKAPRSRKAAAPKAAAPVEGVYALVVVHVSGMIYTRTLPVDDALALIA